jgi:hypothetical protein
VKHICLNICPELTSRLQNWVKLVNEKVLTQVKCSWVQTMVDNLSRTGKVVVSNNEAFRSPESVDKWPLAAAVLLDKSIPFLRHLKISLSYYLSYERLTSDFLCYRR